MLCLVGYIPDISRGQVAERRAMAMARTMMSNSGMLLAGNPAKHLRSRSGEEPFPTPTGSTGSTGSTGPGPYGRSTDPTGLTGPASLTITDLIHGDEKTL